MKDNVRLVLVIAVLSLVLSSPVVVQLVGGLFKFWSQEIPDYQW